MEKVIVIGANHAGTHVITTLLDNYKNIQVTTYDKNDNISFLGCGMALWIGHQIEGSDGLFYATPQELEASGAVVNMQHDVEAVDFNNKTITVRNLKTSELRTDTYDKLVLATGSWPVLPKLPGSELNNITYAKIFQNAKDAVDKSCDLDVNDIVVVGAGYIGVELAEAYQRNGKNVTLINDQEILNTYYDEPFQEMMHKRLTDSGINVVLGQRVEEFIGDDMNNVTHVKTKEGLYKADVVLMAVGFKPNTQMFEATELELSEHGAILVNNHQETSIKDVYAVGDCATIYSNASKSAENICLATNAVRTGIVAAHNIGGTSIAMQGVQGSNAIHIYGLTLASTGLTLRRAKELGYDTGSVIVDELIKPAFMTENDSVKLQIIWDRKTRRILGAQMASEADITLALHMFSLAIQEDYSIDKLALLDLFFLPHFNQPVNFITKAGLLALGK